MLQWIEMFGDAGMGCMNFAHREDMNFERTDSSL